MMTMEEITYWKRELRRIVREFLQTWRTCPKCGSKWENFSWDAESDHEFIFVECKSSHLFRADDQFWLYEYDGIGVYVPTDSEGGDEA